MIGKAKLGLIATVVAVGLASPAVAQSVDSDYGTGNSSKFSYGPATLENATRYRSVYPTPQQGIEAYAMDPRRQLDFNSNSPAAAGGGSVGYNQKLLDN